MQDCLIAYVTIIMNTEDFHGVINAQLQRLVRNSETFSLQHARCTVPYIIAYRNMENRKVLSPLPLQTTLAFEPATLGSPSGEMAPYTGCRGAHLRPLAQPVREPGQVAVTI